MRHSIHSVFYDQAEAHEAAGRYPEALALYYQVHRWAPADPDLWLRLGVLSYLTTDPDWQRARGSDGTHAADMGCVNAEAYLDKAVSLAPDAPAVRFWRGWVRHRLLSDPEGAEADYRSALEASPQHPYAHAALARLRLERDPADARAHFASALAALPESARLHYDMGACLARLGLDAEARRAFEAAAACPRLPVPSGPGGAAIADAFHGDPAAIAAWAARFYPDVLEEAPPDPL